MRCSHVHVRRRRLVRLGTEQRQTSRAVARRPQRDVRTGCEDELGHDCCCATAPPTRRAPRTARPLGPQARERRRSARKETAGLATGNTFSLLVRMQEPGERSPRGSNCANETARPRRAESSGFSVTLRSTSSAARVLRTVAFLLRNLSHRCGIRGGKRRLTPADRSGAISTCFSFGTPNRRTYDSSSFASLS